MLKKKKREVNECYKNRNNFKQIETRGKRMTTEVSLIWGLQNLA